MSSRLYTREKGPFGIGDLPRACRLEGQSLNPFHQLAAGHGAETTHLEEQALPCTSWPAENRKGRQWRGHGEKHGWL